VIVEISRDIGLAIMLIVVGWILVRKFDKTIATKIFYSFFILGLSVAVAMQIIGRSEGNEYYGTINVVLALLVTGLIVFLVKWERKSIINPIKRISEAGKIISSGNLNIDLTEMKGKDEICEIQNSFVYLVGFLRKLIGDSKEIIESLTTSAEEMASTSEEVSSGSENIATSQQQISKGAAEQVGAISEVQRKITYLNEGIKDIGSKLQDIDEISNLLKGISDQTNMLALNAAIESARAGELGKGFSVVANQVRALSEESKKAVNSTEQKIQAIKQVIIKQETNSMDIIQQVDKIAVVSEETSSSTEESVAAAEEQAASMEQINMISETLLQSVEKMQKNFEQIQL
jgi:methyl-accepting chemotaxis protein